MSEEQFTCCPGCRTVFRVTSEQLAMRDGQVRCGHCKSVFDGNAQRVALAAPPPTAVDVSLGDAALGPPTVTLREAQALHPPDVPAERAGAPAAPEAGEVPYEERFSRTPRKKSRLARTLGYAFVIILLFALIAAQAVYHFRDWLAAHWPTTRPALASVCAVAGCAIRPLRDAAMDHLSIAASDLQADPAHRGLLVLTATLRNFAAWSLAYPYLELTLTDAQDQVVVRRALAPADYAGGTTDLEGGIPPNGEVAVKMFIDASSTTQAGYRLYMFYP